MKTYLIHTPIISGHQLEYLHHLYLGALERPSDKFFFVVPSRFTVDSAKLDWPEAVNIRPTVACCPRAGATRRPSGDMSVSTMPLMWWSSR